MEIESKDEESKKGWKMTVDVPAPLGPIIATNSLGMKLPLQEWTMVFIAVASPVYTLHSMSFHERTTGTKLSSSISMATSCR